MNERNKHKIEELNILKCEEKKKKNSLLSSNYLNFQDLRRTTNTNTVSKNLNNSGSFNILKSQKKLETEERIKENK